jgi:hypothetical protein
MIMSRPALTEIKMEIKVEPHSVEWFNRLEQSMRPKGLLARGI